MKTLVTILLVMFLSVSTSAQTDTLNVYKIREFGVNTTPFLRQFISIGDISERAVSRSFIYKRFKASKKRGFRFGLGLHFESDSFTQTDQVIHISLGSERRRNINENWYYYFGCDGFINARPDFTSNDVFGNGIGADIVMGIVFQINKYLSLSTETIVAATLGDGFTWQISPPLSLYFNFRTFKKTHY